MKGLILLIVGINISLISCNNIPDCDDANTSTIILQFMDSAFTVSKEESFDEIRDIRMGIVFVEDFVSDTIELEINPSDTLTQYLFEGGGEIDTLTVGYDQSIFLRSEDCGPVLTISDLVILKHTFTDTLVVNNELLKDVVNIQIIR